MRKFLIALVALAVLLPPGLGLAATTEDDLQQKINDLQQQLKALQGQVQKIKEQKEAAPIVMPAATPVADNETETKTKTATWPNWLRIGGDYRARLDYLSGDAPAFYDFLESGKFADQVYQYMHGGPVPTVGPTEDAATKYKNHSLLTNRFGLNITASPLDNVNVKARLLMYKIWGSETENPLDQNLFFMDRAGTFDGVLGHVPSSDYLGVDYAYATWYNIAGQPLWFSIGRRPSTSGVPGNIRQNAQTTGTAGVPSPLIDYAFDGLSIGYAPYIDALPGAYAKICAGRGFDSGFSKLHDTNFVGLFLVPYSTDNLSIELLADKGIDIFDVPPDFALPTTAVSQNGIDFNAALNPTTNVGNIYWYGGVVQGKVLDNLNLFASAALSDAHPNGNKAGAFAPFIGQAFAAAGVNPTPQEVQAFEPQMLDGQNHTGEAFYVGARYDLPTGTKIGAEYNYGSKYWIGFVPAGDDMWTSKVGTRGNVYEGYIIQELHGKKIDKLAKAYFRLGYQYYDFQYTGSNNWLGTPVKISDLLASPNNMQMFPVIKKAQDIYLTFEVHF
ncbi:MAG: DUF3373 family protein [Nitrospiraceae bacterium]|nr:DUF3373 family protein [Nitrospiraceae bacterium]